MAFELRNQVPQLATNVLATAIFSKGASATASPVVHRTNRQLVLQLSDQKQHIVLTLASSKAHRPQT
jgi:ribosomal protein L18